MLELEMPDHELQPEGNFSGRAENNARIKFDLWIPKKYEPLIRKQLATMIVFIHLLTHIETKP